MAAKKTKDPFQWDFFLAHAGKDGEAAEALYDELSQSSVRSIRVFLDSRSLQPGDDWDLALARAQRASKVTVVLVSKHTDTAYYQREEIAAAIAMAREDATRHRVVPVFLEEGPDIQESLPYGLRLKHGLSVAALGGLEKVASRLEDLLDAIDEVPAAILAKRIKAEDEEQAQPVSLKSLAEGTEASAKAFHGFAAALESAVASGIRVIDVIKDRRERARLHNLLRNIMLIETSQVPLPWALRDFLENDSDSQWAQIRNVLTRLVPIVSESAELLASCEGNFLVINHDAYKQLLVGLRGRSQIYEEIMAMKKPTAEQDFAYLRKTLTQYEKMIEDLKKIETILATYLAKERA